MVDSSSQTRRKEMAKYTPTPWSVEKDLKGTNLIIRGAQYSGRIATVTPNEDSQEANAMIMADAPLLLDALKYAVMILEKKRLNSRENSSLGGLKTMLNRHDPDGNWTAMDRKAAISKTKSGNQ